MENDLRKVGFTCPHCGQPLEAASDFVPAAVNCPHCNQLVNLEAQEIVMRAQEAYLWALTNGTPDLLDARRRPDQLSPPAKDALRAYLQAYTGLQAAFRNKLPSPHREVGIEIMAEVTRILACHMMVSKTEVEYWTQLMVCQTADQEYQDLGKRLSQSRPSIFTRLFRHPRWRLRRFQLKRALVRRRARVQELEWELAFVEPLHTHNGPLETQT